MVLSADVLANRHQHVGASDVAAILGYDRFKTYKQLLDSKLNPKPQEPATVGSSVWYGNCLEDGIMQMMTDKLLLKNVQSQPEHTNGILVSHPDGIASSYSYKQAVKSLPCLIEIKTTGFTGDPPEEWGRAGSQKNIPVRVFIQVQAQLHAARAEHPGIKRCFVGCLHGVGHRGLPIYPVDYSPAAGRKIQHAIDKFWNDLESRRRS